MFKQLRLWANILIVIGVAIVLSITTLTLVSLNSLTHASREAEQAKLGQLAAMVQTKIAAEVRLAEALGRLVASQPEVQARFAARDRDWLTAQFHPVFEALKRDYGAVQFQFHTPPATSFLRLHLLEKSGDDLSGFRPTVVEANRDQRPRHGLELGVGGLGARGVVPILMNGRHLGSVEFGMSFGQPFFDAFKAEHGVEAALFLLDGGKVKAFASTHGEQPLLSAAAIQSAYGGTPQTAELDRDGQALAVYAEVVRDYAGTPLGVIEIAMDRSTDEAILAATLNQILLVSLVVTVFSIGIALLTARAIARRIARLAAGVKRMSNGDLTGNIPIDGSDELADLGHVLDGMRNHLHELVAGVATNAAAVHTASREIAKAVDSQAATSSELSASVAEITSTMEELSASSSQIAEYSESVVTIASRTYDDSQRGAEAMQALAARMQRIGEDNQRALNEILALGTRSKEISRIMEIIDTVADRTRLIAFNAALEAASAGEAGKRFGVVAAEIRRLADSVTESTDEITTKVAEIQESINRLVVSSEKGSAGIQQGLADSANTAEVLRALVQAASETSTSAQQISLSTQQQRTASNQVVVALREIVTASQDTAQTVRQIAQHARAMNALSTRLATQMDQFALTGTVAASTADGRDETVNPA